MVLKESSNDTLKDGKREHAQAQLGVKSGEGRVKKAEKAHEDKVRIIAFPSLTAIRHP